MTVIATDGRTIAADSQTTFGSERGLRSTEKIVVDGDARRIYAACGVSILPVLVQWHKDGADPGKMPVLGGAENWSLLVLDRYEGQLRMVLYWKDAPYPQIIDPPFGFGSGGEFATGAMDAGASPQEAVAIAIRRSTSCGGAIQVVDIASALGLPRAVKEAAE